MIPLARPSLDVYDVDAVRHHIAALEAEIQVLERQKDDIGGRIHRLTRRRDLLGMCLEYVEADHD